jgi:hypothetical protein
MVVAVSLVVVGLVGPTTTSNTAVYKLLMMGFPKPVKLDLNDKQ